MTRLSASLWLLLLLAVAACRTAKTPASSLISSVSIDDERFLDGFEPGLQVADKPLWCEASAVLFDGRAIWIANDKAMPDNRSSVAVWPSRVAFEQRTQPTYRTDSLLRMAQKFEDFALSPNKEWVFLTTAFDRVTKVNASWDGYNLLLAWPTAANANVQNVMIGTNAMALRQQILGILSQHAPAYPNGVAYAKIEGIAATNDRLILGVREIGNTYQDFSYVTALLSIPYLVSGNGATPRVVLADSLEYWADLKPASLTDVPLPPQTALSSIEYDPARGRFWLLTSVEDGATLGAYLWTATETELRAGRMTLLKSADGQPLRLSHKAEDITPLGMDKLLIVNDDDRQATKIGDQVRQPQQAAFTILTVK